MARRTRYQATRRPVKVTEVHCPATDTWEEFGKGIRCTTCRRALYHKVRHLPGIDGKFGWTEHYADGSTYQVAPGDTPKRP